MLDRAIPAATERPATLPFHISDTPRPLYEDADVFIVDGIPFQYRAKVWSQEDAERLDFPTRPAPHGSPVRISRTITNLVSGVSYRSATPEQVQELAPEPRQAGTFSPSVARALAAEPQYPG